MTETMQIKLGANMAEEDVRANVRTNIDRIVPHIKQCEAHEGHAVLVGGGPSLADTLWEVRRRKEDGQTIFALNGAGKWLEAQGITPDYVVMLDPRPSNVAFLGPHCEYLLASQCSPAVFDAAAHRYPVRMWHYAEPALQELIHELTHGNCVLLGGGLTVGITAMALVYVLGYRWQHLYGYDSSDRDGEAHAYDQTEDSEEKKRVEVICDGRTFWSQTSMYAQAQMFPDWAQALAEEGAQITVHGDGLLQARVRTMTQPMEVTT